MKVFLSWSKDTSKQYATIFRDWLPNVIQDIEPFISEKDISLGRRGVDEIEANLDSYKVAIFFVTDENKNEPWLLYEHGALSRQIHDDQSRIIPLLIDLERSDIPGSPLSHYQNAETVDKESIRSLVSSMNGARDKPLTEQVLDNAIDKWWPDLETQLQSIETEIPHAKPVNNKALASKIDKLSKEIIDLRDTLGGMALSSHNMRVSIMGELSRISKQNAESFGSRDADNASGDSSYANFRYLAALHDAGKDSKGFQRRLEEGK